MSLSRKHFKAIAEIISKHMATHGDNGDLPMEFAKFLATTNDNFDKSRFLDACWTGESEGEKPSISI